MAHRFDASRHVTGDPFPMVDADRLSGERRWYASSPPQPTGARAWSPRRRACGNNSPGSIAMAPRAGTRRSNTMATLTEPALSSDGSSGPLVYHDAVQKDQSTSGSMDAPTRHSDPFDVDPAIDNGAPVWSPTADVSGFLHPEGTREGSHSALLRERRRATARFTRRPCSRSTAGTLRPTGHQTGAVHRSTPSHRATAGASISWPFRSRAIGSHERSWPRRRYRRTQAPFSTPTTDGSCITRMRPAGSEI